MIREIQAPDKPGPSSPSCRVFLAGGITGCRNWQQEVIDHLKYYEQIYGNFGEVQVFNPRRDNFDVEDPSVTIEQIRWEHEWLKKCDIFSVFFEASKSVQPISLYELGKHANGFNAVITVEKGYLREEDVLIQTALDKLYCGHYDHGDAANQHAREIAYRISRFIK